MTRRPCSECERLDRYADKLKTQIIALRQAALGVAGYQVAEGSDAGYTEALERLRMVLDMTRKS